jgi:hypothetical protein
VFFSISASISPAILGSRRIAVHRAEVALAFYERIAHGEGLGQSDHGLVDGRVSMGVVLAHNISHHTGGLLEGLIVGHALLVHGVKNASVDGLQPIPYVRQRSTYDHAHGIIDVGRLHLISDIDIYFRQKPPQTSRFFTYLAWVSMNSFLGST